MKRQKKAVVTLLMTLLMLFCFSLVASGKTVSEEIAAPAGNTVVFTVTCNGRSVEYTWDDVACNNGRFTAYTAAYSAKDADDNIISKDWTGIKLSDVLADAAGKLGLVFAAEQIIATSTIDNYVSAFTMADISDKANNFMLACDPVSNSEDGKKYDNSYVRILRVAETPNNANYRCITGLNIKIESASGDIQPAVTPAAGKVQVSTQKLTVNGKAVDSAAYNIDGYNYFRLRDVAYALKDTSAKFSVDYDSVRKLVTATSGQNYIAVGGEMVFGGDKSATCVPSTHAALFNKVASTAYCYNIGGNNYFQLRGLGEAFGFDVSYDNDSRTMQIVTEKQTAVTINGVAYTYDQLAKAGAVEKEYVNKAGSFTALGCTFEQLLGTAIPKEAQVTVTYTEGSGYGTDTFSGGMLANALLLYSANGVPIVDQDKAGGSAFVRLYIDKGLNYVKAISW